jgi:hypothetical protein
MHEVLYWTFLFAIPFASALMAAAAYKQKRRFAASLWVSVMFTFIIYSLVSAWWFFSGASDGFSQILGVVYYGLAWCFTIIINSVVLIFMRGYE